MAASNEYYVEIYDDNENVFEFNVSLTAEEISAFEALVHQKDGSLYMGSSSNMIAYLDGSTAHSVLANWGVEGNPSDHRGCSDCDSFAFDASPCGAA